MSDNVRNGAGLRPGEVIVLAVLAAYAAGFMAFPPRALLVVDESLYVSQAMAFAQGGRLLEGARILVPPDSVPWMSNFPPGTSLLQTPLVALGGWRAAAALSVLSLVIATLATMFTLRRTGAPPAFALLVPGFAGSLLFGRMAMRDMPSAAIVALGLLMFLDAGAGRGRIFAGGLLAGTALLFREPNVLLMAPFVAGAIVPRRQNAVPVLAGVAAGVGLRLLIANAMFGDPLFVRASGYGFSAAGALHNAPQYFVILMLFVPLGLALPFLYRGPLRREMVSAIALFVGLYLFYDYSSERENGAMKGLVLSMRYMIPALPLLAVMAADVAPRVFDSLPDAARSLARRAGVPAGIALIVAVFGSHVAVHRLEAAPLRVVTAIRNATRAAVPLIINSKATFKYVSPVYGPRRLILRDALSGEEVPELLRTLGRLQVVFLDRGDSEMFVEDAGANQHFLEIVRTRCTVKAVLSEQIDKTLRLNVFEVAKCG